MNHKSDSIIKLKYKIFVTAVDLPINFLIYFQMCSIPYKIFVTTVDLPINFLISSQMAQLKNFQNKKHYYLIHTKQFSEFQYQFNLQDLLHMPHPLFDHADYL